MVTIKLKRILTHLWSGERPLRRAFPASALRQIEQAIQRSEASYSGELRFVVEAALDIGPLWAGTSAADRALELFSQLRIWDTEQNNGVLIYLLLAERDVEIIADRGIHRRVGSAGSARSCWSCQRRSETTSKRSASTETGFASAFRATSATRRRRSTHRSMTSCSLSRHKARALTAPCPVGVC